MWDADNAKKGVHAHNENVWQRVLPDRFCIFPDRRLIGKPKGSDKPSGSGLQGCGTPSSGAHLRWPRHDPCEGQRSRFCRGRLGQSVPSTMRSRNRSKLVWPHRLDWGFDFQGTEHSSFQSFSAAMTARYELLKNLRLETGIGLGDDTEGKSLTGEVGATMGIPGGKRNGWAPYASVRLAAARGRSGRPFAGSNVPPGAVVPMASIGASARVSENMRWVVEGGSGGILSREHTDAGAFVYVAVGLDFVLRRKE